MSLFISLFISFFFPEAHKLPWNHAIYMNFDKKWDLRTQCAVLDSDDCEPGAEAPQFAVDNNLGYVLSIQKTQDTYANAVAQKDRLLIQELFEAFLYYCNNDAFIEFGDT